MKKIAIVTVNYNGQKDTLEFLSSLKKLDTDNFEVKTVVVDNASTNSSVEEITKAFPKADLVQTGYNGGFSGGYNRGLEFAKAWGADYFLVINNDTLINSPDLLKELVKTIESDSKIGLVAPKIYFAKGYEFHKDRYQDSDLGKVIWYAGGSFDWANVNSKHRGIDEVDVGKYDEVEQVDFVSGCCFLTKVAVLDEVGVFDDNLFAYFEDNDLSERLKEKGFKKFYNGQVSIYHKVSQTAGLGSPISDYFGTRNRLIFGKRYASFRTNFALWRQAFKYLLTGRLEQKRGVIDFFKGITGAPQRFIKENSVPDYAIKLSVIIVNYNTAELVRELLESIYFKKSGYKNQTTEVILLDNGLLDPSDQIVKKFPEVRHLVNQENTGFTGGNNRGIKFSRGQYVLLLNSDIQVLENGLSELVKAAEEYDDNAVVGGRLYFPDMSDQDSCFHLPTISGAIKEYFFYQRGAYFMYLPKQNHPVQVEGFIMACFLIPRKVLNKVGLLDEGTFMFFEDIEYCRRLKRNNIKMYFYPNSKYIHYNGASHKQLKEGEAYKMLVKGSLYYHGPIYYKMLYIVMWLGQKFGTTKTPISR